MEHLVSIVTLSMASVLLWAGLEKARSLASVVSILRQLGVSGSVARTGGPLLVAAEVGVALGLIFRPGSAGTLGGVLALSGAFAVSGLVALRQNKVIRCGCFGPGGDSYLGKRQMAVFPLWCGGVAFLWIEGAPHPSVSGGFSLLAMVGLALASMRAVAALRASKVAQGDRRSAEEMLLWLRR